MRRNRSIVITAFIAVAALAGCSSSGDPVASPSSTATAYQAALEQQIPELMKANAIPGVGVLIRSREQGDWQATFGTAAGQHRDDVDGLGNQGTGNGEHRFLHKLLKPA